MFLHTRYAPIIYVLKRNVPHLLKFFARSKCNKPLQLGPPWSVIFFGTDNFALCSLKALWAKLNTGTTIDKLDVVCKPGSVVRKFAESEGLKVYNWPVAGSDIETKYHIGMVVSFGNLIPPDVINALPLGCVNVHASLLPRWRGAAPIVHTILNGDSETGITIMRIHPHRFDVGEVVRQYRLAVAADETTPQLEARLAECGSSLLMECVRDLPRSVTTAIPQPKHGITYAPKINSSLSVVDWKSSKAREVYNIHRALSHTHPVLTRWRGQPIKLVELRLDPSTTHQMSQVQTPESTSNSLNSALDFLESKTQPPSSSCASSDSPPGTLYFDKKTRVIKVICADGLRICISKVSFAGKVMSASDFYNGFMSKVSRNLWQFSDSS